MARKIRAAQLTEHRPTRTAYAAGTPRLLAAEGGARYRLLAGPAPHLDEGTCEGLVLTDVDAVDAAQTLGSSMPNELSTLDKMRLAIALSGEVKATALCHLLGESNHPEVWRWTALRHTAPELREAVLAGTLSRGHVRPLLRMTRDEQAEWTKRAIRGRWSVRALAAMVARERAGKAPEPPPAADTLRLQERLGLRLGAPVRLDWPDLPSDRALVIGYSDMETLKGVFQELARGPEGSADPGRTLRYLRIEVADSDELESLTGHLLAE